MGLRPANALRTSIFSGMDRIFRGDISFIRFIYPFNSNPFNDHHGAHFNDLLKSVTFFERCEESAVHLDDPSYHPHEVLVDKPDKISVEIAQSV